MTDLLRILVGALSHERGSHPILGAAIVIRRDEEGAGLAVEYDGVLYLVTITPEDPS